MKIVSLMLFFVIKEHWGRKIWCVCSVACIRNIYILC